jgi:hypothetical protein
MAVKQPDKKQIENLAINHDLSCRQIAAITGAGKTRIAEIIQEVKKNPDILEFSSKKDAIFEGLQAKLINLADDDLLKTMLSKRGFTDVAILEDKIRNIRGLATSISEVDIRMIVASLPCNRPDVPDAELSTGSNNKVSASNN